MKSLVELVCRIETTMNLLQDDLRGISTGGNLEGTTRQARIADAVWASSGLIDLPDQNQYQKATPSPIATDQKTMCTKILASLRFEGMTDRGERIAPAYPDTFKWLFNDEQDVSLGKNFRQWLQSENKEIFWITGKPASGKSTLMKFISTHQCLRSDLYKWAGGSHFFLATFYFWGPGSKAQRSRVGLLRSLLYQLLSQQPDLCPLVAPRRRILFDLAGIDAVSPDWQWTELRECLLRFASNIQHKMPLVLFIDGLDEYDGNHEELVAFFKQLHREYNPKLCISSRPWNVFSDEFRYNPSLRMEDLTKLDIDIYIKGRLGSSHGIQELRQLEPESITRLMEEIRDRAEGVFLWVVLVVQQLRTTARDSPRLPAIWKAFNALPRGLEELYEAIQRTIGESKQEMASKLYQLVMEWKRTWNGQIQATLLWCAIDCTEPLQPIWFPGPSRENSIIPLVSRFLAGHTKGILQVSAKSRRSRSPTVDFLHRTAFDWLQMERNSVKIRSQGPHGFYPILTLIAVLVGHLQRLGPPNMETPTYADFRRQCIFRILKFAREVENTAENRAKLVTILDRIESKRLLPVDLEPMFRDTFVSTSNRTVHNGLVTFAAAWGCLPYVQAKCDASPHILQVKRQSILPWIFSKPPTPISLLEASVLGGVNFGKHKDGWFNEARGFTQLQTSQRLDTIRFLLDNNVKPDNHLKKSMKKLTDAASIEGDYEDRYWTLVDKMFEHRSSIIGVDGMKHRLLSGIEEPHLGDEFPEFEIRPDSWWDSGIFSVDNLTSYLRKFC